MVGSTQEPPSELDRWLTPRLLGGSDLMSMMFDAIHAGACSIAEAQETSLAALYGFGNGSCYFLASAVVMARGGVIAGFRRRQDDDRLVHATIVDSRDGYACDILGKRPLAAVRAEIAGAVGGVRTTVLPPLGDEIDREEISVLTRIAAGLPWMGLDMPRPDHAEWSALVHAYVDARGTSRARRHAVA